jgi:chromate transporter
MTPAPNSPESSRGTALEVFCAFLRLGLLSFGGPIAHLGYFQSEFVERRRWCSRETFAEIIAIAQSLPGPASSQVGFSLGLLRAGWLGGLAAWTAFTMPSALVMLAFAFGHRFLTGRLGLGVVHGLQLVAVAVVAQAILSMRKSLAPDAPRLALALVAALIVFFSYGTLAAIVVGAAFGLILPRPAQPAPMHPLGFRLPKSAALISAALFFLLLVALPVATSLTRSQPIAVFNAFYRTGALVFGGGHVVLPLLESAVVAPGWVDQQTFLSGYGAAQALPGPLFTFAAFLGASIHGAGGPYSPSFGECGIAASPLAHGLLALIAIFLPGLLAVVAVLPFWSELRQLPSVQGVLRGVNAAVVGVLIAAFVRPVCSSALHSSVDVAIALAALVALLRWKLSPWIVVLSVALLSTLVIIV